MLSLHENIRITFALRTWQNKQTILWAQHRLRSAWASSKLNQESLATKWWHSEVFDQTQGRCQGWSVYSLGGVLFCWFCFCHVLALVFTDQLLLTLCILMNYSIWFHTMSLELLIVCIKGSQVTIFQLTLNAPTATKVVCFSRLLKCLRSLYGKQCGPRSDCSYRSSGLDKDLDQWVFQPLLFNLMSILLHI